MQVYYIKPSPILILAVCTSPCIALPSLPLTQLSLAICHLLPAVEKTSSLSLHVRLPSVTRTYANVHYKYQLQPLLSFTGQYRRKSMSTKGNLNVRPEHTRKHYQLHLPDIQKQCHLHVHSVMNQCHLLMWNNEPVPAAPVEWMNNCHRHTDRMQWRSVKNSCRMQLTEPPTTPDHNKPVPPTRAECN